VAGRRSGHGQDSANAARRGALLIARATTVAAADYGRIEVVEVAHYAPPDVPVLALSPSVEARLREAAGEDKGANFMLASIQGEARDHMARRADS